MTGCNRSIAPFGEPRCNRGSGAVDTSASQAQQAYPSPEDAAAALAAAVKTGTRSAI
jgi:hypothetical protein